jgi:integrase
MVDKGRFRVRGKQVDPRTGRTKEVDQLVEAATANAAAAMRADLLAALVESHESTRTRVSDYAKSWIESKAACLDKGTADRYADALEHHVVPTLGAFYYDALKPADVQAWINKMLRASGPNDKPYAIETVRAWFRVFRTMTRDAIVQLDLTRDCTSRINFPDAQEREEANALTPEELSKFLEAMRTQYPRNYALTVTLAFTGLRFCHASGLKWEDVDEEKGMLRIVRKNVRRRVGPVSRRKRAPREYPLVPELATILREHRHAMLQEQAPGFGSGWVFPSRAGTLRCPGSLWKAWQGCLHAIGLEKRFTVHGLRRTFNDLARRAGADGIVIRSLTGHVTEKMREHYSTVALDEKRQTAADVVQLVAAAPSPTPASPPDKKAAAGGETSRWLLLEVD